MVAVSGIFIFDSRTLVGVWYAVDHNLKLHPQHHAEKICPKGIATPGTRSFWFCFRLGWFISLLLCWRPLATHR